MSLAGFKVCHTYKNTSSTFFHSENTMSFYLIKVIVGERTRCSDSKLPDTGINWVYVIWRAIKRSINVVHDGTPSGHQKNVCAFVGNIWYMYYDFVSMYEHPSVLLFCLYRISNQRIRRHKILNDTTVSGRLRTKMKRDNIMLVTISIRVVMCHTPVKFLQCPSKAEIKYLKPEIDLHLATNKQIKSEVINC